MICGVSHPHISSLSEEAVPQAISKAFEDITYETFTEASSAIAEALLPTQDLINSTIHGLLEVPSEGESARNVVRFILSTAGEQYIRQLCLTMTEGFCEYLEIAKIWIVAQFVFNLLMLPWMRLSRRKKWISNGYAQSLDSSEKLLCR